MATPQPPPPPTPPKPLVVKQQAKPVTKSLQDTLREAQLKKTEGPTVRGLGLKVVNVLLLTKYWGCYAWFSEVS